MARVVLVHGVAQQFEGPELLSLRLGAALRDGVKLATGTVLQPEDVACAFYGNCFIEPGTRSNRLPAWDEHDVEDGLEAELLDAWWRQAAEIDDGVEPADEDGTRGPAGYAASRLLLSRWVRERLNALTQARFFQPVSERMLIGELKQVRRYLDEPPVWQAARAAVAAEISADTRVVVAHSLGSVVAYEALCENPDWPVTDLVTVGSPLGLPVIHRRLSPLPVEGRGAWPGGVVRWTNVADPGDIVALVGALAPRFVSGPGEGVADRRITNGVRMHDFERYLTAQTTATAVAAALRAPHA
ncbi:antibiotic ABC transporter ATP-binding protein [Streptomyces sp. NBC_00056]|uniref:antibiotic ABC transporter ATP-binding protein n=1 Tax=unclassified Streptomyces TaxID=2593676 RepID=UPI002E80E9C9|nr:antibiotic ABC transporter ATP-binding protein [Streptomyces sp. NBC_00569]WUB92660.1 antibiotic ABC transporter ATP-binding protein [Streptomyces sp. NBC_00569]